MVSSEVDNFQLTKLGNSPTLQAFKSFKFDLLRGYTCKEFYEAKFYSNISESLRYAVSVFWQGDLCWVSQGPLVRILIRKLIPHSNTSMSYLIHAHQSENYNV